MDARIKSGHDECVWWDRFAHSNFNFQTANLKRDFAFPRRNARELCQNHAPKKTEGVGNAGCATHPQPRVRNKTKHTSVVTARFAEITRHSRTQWF
jgi:hypothetical protein